MAKKQQKTEYVPVRMPPELRKLAQAEADKRVWPLSQYVRWCVEQQLKKK